MLTRLLWPPSGVPKIAERLPLYVEARARAELGLQAESIRLHQVDSGEESVLRRWETEKKGTIYVRAWPSNPAIRPAAEHLKAGGMLAKAGLTVPKVFYCDDSFSTMRRWRLEAIFEARAEGEPYDTTKREHVRYLGEVASRLAGLHSVGSAEWGKPWRPRNEMADPRVHFEQRVRSFRARINPRTSSLTVALLQRGLTQIESRLENIEIQWPVLLHGDVHRQHLYVTREGRLTWINFSSVQFGLPEHDLAGVRSTLLNQEAFARFLDLYRKGLKNEREIDKEAITTFVILRSWERLSQRIRRRHTLAARQSRGEAPDPRLERVRMEIHQLEDFLSRVIARED